MLAKVYFTSKKEDRRNEGGNLMLFQIETSGRFNAEDLQLVTRKLITHDSWAVLLAASLVPPGIGQRSNPENPKNVLALAWMGVLSSEWRYSE